MNEQYNQAWVAAAKGWQTLKETLQQSREGISAAWCDEQIDVCESKYRFCMLRAKDGGKVIGDIEPVY